MFQSLAIFDNEKKDLMLELRWPQKKETILITIILSDKYVKLTLSDISKEILEKLKDLEDNKVEWKTPDFCNTNSKSIDVIKKVDDPEKKDNSKVFFV